MPFPIFKHAAPNQKYFFQVAAVRGAGKLRNKGPGAANYHHQSGLTCPNTAGDRFPGKTNRIYPGKGP